MPWCSKTTCTASRSVEPPGAITSFFVKAMNCELIGEPRLADNFRINLPLPDDQSHYIEGMKQSPQSVAQEGNTRHRPFQRA